MSIITVRDAHHEPRRAPPRGVDRLRGSPASRAVMTFIAKSVSTVFRTTGIVRPFGHREDTMPTVRSSILTLAVASIFGASAHAHHAFTAQYDAKMIIKLQGVVSKVEWTNPHIHVYLDVKDDGGKIATWALEGFPPRALTRLGWTRNLVKPGDPLTVRAFASKNGSMRANMKELTLQDGRTIAVGAVE
jgi:hypothetical protein